MVAGKENTNLIDEMIKRAAEIVSEDEALNFTEEEHNYTMNFKKNIERLILKEKRMMAKKMHQ